MNLFKIIQSVLSAFVGIQKNSKFNEDDKITLQQAEKLVMLLQRAVAQEMNVIVHCNAGICRSGAVCEIGVMLGMKDKKFYRNPNLLVKSLMMKSLNWTYESVTLPTIGDEL